LSSHMEISFSCLRLKLLAVYQSAFFVDKMVAMEGLEPPTFTF